MLQIYTPVRPATTRVGCDLRDPLSARTAARPESARSDGWLAGRSPTVVVVRGVPWWGLVSSAVAPVLLVGGWTVAAGLLPGCSRAPLTR